MAFHSVYFLSAHRWRHYTYWGKKYFQEWLGESLASHGFVAYVPTAPRSLLFLPVSCDYPSPVALDPPQVLKESPSPYLPWGPCSSSPLTHFDYILTSLQHFLQCHTITQIFLGSLISLLQITNFLSSLFCLQLPAEQEAASRVGDSVLHLCLLTSRCLFTAFWRENICAYTAIFCHWWIGIDLDFLPLHSGCFPWNKKN